MSIVRAILAGATLLAASAHAAPPPQGPEPHRDRNAGPAASIVTVPDGSTEGNTEPGACCLPGGGCVDGALELLCVANEGFFLGSDVTCASTPCPAVDACGCMDVVLVLDDTGSVGGVLDSLADGIDAILSGARFVTAGDARVGVVTFADDIEVDQPLTTDHDAVEQVVEDLVAAGGGNNPEASDEAIRLVATGASACPVDGALGVLRPECLKIAVLVTDSTPGGCDDAYADGIDDANALAAAIAAAQADVLVSAILVDNGSQITPAHPLGVEPDVMAAYAETTNGMLRTVPSNGTGTDRAVLEVIAACGTTAPRLTLEVPPGCASDEQLAVEVWMRDLDELVAQGFQAFLRFDESALQFDGAASTYTALPFPMHIQPIATADVQPGRIRLDASDVFGGPGSSADALLATLVFDVATECATTAVTFDLDQLFDSELSFQGLPLPTVLQTTGSFVVDATPPVLDPCPMDVVVAAEPEHGDGCLGHRVTFAPPGATDTCSVPTVSCVPESGSIFPVGTTEVVCTATDACDNSSSCSFLVTVEPTNLVDVEVELVLVFEPVTRCIRFVTDSCAATTDVELSFVDHDADPATAVRASATIAVPCGPWTILCAKDEQHTLWDTTTLANAGALYVADTVLSLRPGDTDNDGDVDLNDASRVIAQFGGPALAGGCPWDGTCDADFSDNGVIGSEDWSRLSAHWMVSTSCPCASPLAAPAGHRLQTTLSAATLPPDVAARADLNRDGRVDLEDIALFERRHGLATGLAERLPAP